MAKSSIAVKVAEGIGATLAVAAAGYYFYGSKKAKQHRKIATTWAMQMKREVIKQSKQVQKLGPKTVATIVDGVAKTYRDVKNIDASELKQATRELKAHWEQVKQEAGKTMSVKKVKKTAKKK